MSGDEAVRGAIADRRLGDGDVLRERDAVVAHGRRRPGRLGTQHGRRQARDSQPAARRPGPRAPARRRRGYFYVLLPTALARNVIHLEILCGCLPVTPNPDIRLGLRLWSFYLWINV